MIKEYQPQAVRALKEIIPRSAPGITIRGAPQYNQALDQVSLTDDHFADFILDLAIRFAELVGPFLHFICHGCGPLHATNNGR